MTARPDGFSPRLASGWPLRISARPAVEYVWSALRFVGSRLYVPVASHCDRPDDQGAHADGRVVAVDRFRGRIMFPVLDANGQPLTGDDELTDPATVAPAKPKAWWGKAYSTLQAADHTEKKITPAPATRITPKQQ